MKVFAPIDPKAVMPHDLFLIIEISRDNETKRIVESAGNSSQAQQACDVLKKHERKAGRRTRFIVRRKTDIQIVEESQ
jgi:hypothetical protein